MTLSIYKTKPLEGYEWLLPIDRDHYDVLTFDGMPRATNWRPIKVQRHKFREDDGGFRQPCDFPCGCGGHLPMTNRAREKIEPYLARYGEFLPLECADGEFCTFHVTHFVDALDERASDILYASDDPSHVLMIHKHIFRPERLKGDWMFKIPQLRSGFYVTDPFVNLIKDSGLTGLDFRRVWAHR